MKTIIKKRLNFVSYVIIDKTNKKIIAIGSGEYHSRIRPLEISYEKKRPSSGKTPSGLAVQIAAVEGYELEFMTERFETKEEASESEKENHKRYGTCGEDDRWFYINKRKESLGWTEFSPAMEMWLDIIAANGDDIKLSFINKYIHKHPELQEFLGYKGVP